MTPFSFIGNSFRKEGAKTIGRMLATNTTLATIDLECESFLFVFIWMFCSIFKCFSWLTIANQFDEQWIHFIFEGLKVNAVLTSLSLSCLETHLTHCQTILFSHFCNEQLLQSNHLMIKRYWMYFKPTLLWQNWD